MFSKQYMNYMDEMTGEIKETPWEDYGVKVPQIAWQEDRKEEEMESPILPSKSEPTNVYDPNDVHRLHRRRHSIMHPTTKLYLRWRELQASYSIASST